MVTPQTFAEAEKLAQVAMTDAERQMAAGNWRQMMAPLVYGQFVQQNNWPFGGAIAFILMTATLLLTLAANAVVRQRYRAGGA